jgi:hypothetical protein
LGVSSASNFHLLLIPIDHINSSPKAQLSLALASRHSPVTTTVRTQSLQGRWHDVLRRLLTWGQTNLANPFWTVIGFVEGILSIGGQEKVEVEELGIA